MPGIRRRTVLGGTIATGVAGAVLPSSPAIADEVEISDSTTDPTIVLIAVPDAVVNGTVVAGYVKVLDRTRVHRLNLTTFEYSYMSGGDKIARKTTGITSIVQNTPQQFTITYAAPLGQVVGTFTAGLRKARVRWDVTGVANLRPDSFRFAPAVIGTATEDYDPVALWNRDRDPGTGALRGGVPFETTNGVCYSYTWPDNRAFVRVPDSTVGFTTGGFLHAVGIAGADSSSGSVETNVVLGVMRPHAAGVIARDGDLGIELFTDQPFNVWNAGGSATVRLQVSNAGLAARNVRVDWVVRDWSGGEVPGTISGTVGARAVWTPSFTVVLHDRDIRFVEAVLSDAAVPATEVAFARTSLAVLSAYTYVDDPDSSMFGMANYAYLTRPSTIDVLNLMKLIGMKWIRTAYKDYNTYGASLGPTVDVLDREGFAHNMQLARTLPWGGVDAQAWADDMVGRASYSGARYYECGNELNLTAAAKTPQQYVDDVLVPLRDAMIAKQATFKVMHCGLGGFPEQWVQDFGATGGWDHVDVLAYHPGRGNYVADYDPPEPWSNETRWNFAGTLKKAHAVADGNKELWLTEAYAPTRPNRWWTDTYRHAAENVLLQLALAKVFHVQCVNWYTLNDSTQYQPMEADPGEQEFHYGLLNRDLSPKPSLLAFATMARWLDQVEWSDWLGWADLGDPQLFGLVFGAPSGKVNILWSRKDGYILNDDPARRISTNTDYYRTPEPWEDMWPTKTNVTVPTPAASTTVRELNCLGMDVATHQASDSQVTVTLDGSPRIFIGLALPIKSTSPTG